GLSERRHRSLARRRVAVRQCAVFEVAIGQRPHPRRSYGCRMYLHDTADNDAVRKHVIIAPARSLQRASEREPGPEDFDRLKAEFRIEAALNVAGLPEAMLLAREQEIADRIALAPQRLNHAFCLVRRHDGVLFPLEEDPRLREPIRVIERRALAIARFLLWIRSDQPVEIARF